MGKSFSGTAELFNPRLPSKKTIPASHEVLEGKTFSLNEWGWSKKQGAESRGL